jgi:hypothetical protein
MAGTSFPQNQVPNDPSLKDYADLLKKDIMLNTNCHHLATVESFNPLTQTATATINYKKTYFKPVLGTDVYEPYLVDYPVLIDSPVIFPGGGIGAITFPVSKGDECLVLFNDRDIDNWFNGSSSSPVATPRLHSFSDALILVGVRSLANVITNFSSNNIELRTKSGLSKVAVNESEIMIDVGVAGIQLTVSSEGKIKITNPNGEFIASLLQLLQTAFTITMLGNQPLVFDPVTLAIVESFKDGP